MFTDSDWNELSTLSRDRLAQALYDVIGRGTPRERGVVVSKLNLDGSTRHELRWGHAYVEGHMAELRPSDGADPSMLAFEYDKQADFPSAPVPAGDHTLYLDVWERTVTALEDDDLMDAGLHGADTCTRTQTMAQVKWCQTTVDPENPAQNWPIGQAGLSLEIRTGSTSLDPCDPCADEMSLQDDVGNYLFRVELHSVVFDATGQAQQLQLKWSSENGSEQAKVGEEPDGFKHQNWAYEFFSGPGDEFASEKHLGRHFDTASSPRTGELTDGYPNTVPAGYELVRRWDGYCALVRDGSNWKLDTTIDGVDRGTALSTSTAATDHGHVAEGASITLQLDTMTVAIDLAENPLLAGDFWQAPVRQASHSAGSVLLDNALPDGIQHHYMCLGDLIGDTFEPCGNECKRFEFPPLTDIAASDVCYANDVCNMPDVRTVQNAIDHLCKERDLKWHNKHLHGWGIVCGLIAECCSADAMAHHTEVDTDDHHDDVQPAAVEDRRSVCVTKGYALTCNGEDVVLNKPALVPVMDQIEALERAGEVVLENGNGSVCLRIDLGEDGKPEVITEAYNPEKHKKSILDDTLLKDFFDHCIMDLFESIKGEFSFLDADELEVVEEGTTGLVSQQRRKFTSVMNLVFQLLNRDNGQYVYLSHKEHLILRDIYLSLREKLKSKTFCAMFQADDFPDYPFVGDHSSTFFGKNSHKRTKLHPSGKMIYTYAGTDRTINVYELESQKLVEVLEMPAPEGAEITAITFSSDGKLLYATANVRQVDTVFGVAHVGDKHEWERMTILCDVKIMEMIIDPENDERIFATGFGQGLYYLRPGEVLDSTKPQIKPVYAFNASGHMVLDAKDARAYCTSLMKPGDPVRYDMVAICDVNKNGDAMDPTISLPLGGELSGSDGLEIGNARHEEEGHLYVVVDNNKEDKMLLTFARPKDENDREISVLMLENTQVSLAWNEVTRMLVLAMEDSYRLQLVDENGKESVRSRVPVQIQPVDLVADRESGSVYTLNYVSNTLTLIPKNELDYSLEKLNQLAQYRTEALRAFWNLVSGLLQYIKDCFCHHLLVKCPTCDENDVLYLACVEIRDHKVYKICNFDLRKTVKSFPTMEYWFSLLPLEAIIKQAVSKFCCWVLPDFFSKYTEELIPDPEPATESRITETNYFKADVVRNNWRTWERMDSKTIWRDHAKGYKMSGKLIYGGVENFLKTNQINQPGVKKNLLLGAKAEDAVIELGKHKINVVDRQEYDPAKSAYYLSQMRKIPAKMPPDAELIQIEDKGEVISYIMRQPETVSMFKLPDDVVIQVEELEGRKAKLENFDDFEIIIVTAEERHNKLLEMAEVRAKLDEAEARRSEITDFGSFEVKIDAAEERRARLLELADVEAGFVAMETRKATIKDFSELEAKLDEVETRRETLIDLDEAENKLAEFKAKKAEAIAELAEAEAKAKALKEANSVELIRLNEMAARRTALESEIEGFGESFVALEKRNLELKIEMARGLPVREIEGVSAELNRELRALGIHTFEDLRKADANELKARTSITRIGTARVLIGRAGTRINIPGP